MFLLLELAVYLILSGYFKKGIVFKKWRLYNPCDLEFFFSKSTVKARK